MDVVLALATIHAAGAAALVAGIVVLALREAAVFVALWIAAAVALAVPGAGALALAGYRAERALAGRVPPSAHLWAGAGLGVALVAHWLPLCPLAPILGVAALVGPGHRADDHLAGALLAVIAWFGTAAGLVLAAGCARRMARRSWDGAPLVPPASIVPTSLVVATAYAVAMLAPAMAWTTAVHDAARGGDGGLAVLPWLLLGAAAAAFAGGVTGAWVRRAVGGAPRLAIGARNRQAEVAGAILAAHGGVAFAIAIVGLEGERDVQMLILAPSTLVILLGTLLWSLGRTLRIEELRAAT